MGSKCWKPHVSPFWDGKAVSIPLTPFSEDKLLGFEKGQRRLPRVPLVVKSLSNEPALVATTPVDPSSSGLRNDLYTPTPSVMRARLESPTFPDFERSFTTSTEFRL
jgi:hypothetical protein